MGEYVDPRREALDALELQASRRRRLLAGIRGWLRATKRPRWRVAGLLGVSFGAGSLAATAAWTAGLHLPIGVAGFGILVAWLLFARLLHAEARRLCRAFAPLGMADDFLPTAETFVAHDALAEHLEARRLYEPPDPDSPWQRGFRSGMQSGLQQGGPMALPALLIIGLLTLGTWIVWDLLRLSPMLLAETILDGAVAEAEPDLAHRMPIENWRSNALAGTAFHFISLAVVIVVLAGVLRALR